MMTVIPADGTDDEDHPADPPTRIVTNLVTILGGAAAGI